MRTVSIRQIDMKRAVIPLGFEGENEFTTVRIDCKKTFDEHPTAIPSIAVTDPAGNQYPAVIVRDGNYVEWTITASDLTTRGDGEIQIIFTVDDNIIGKTDPAKTRINRSITPSGQVPSGIQNFIQQAGTILQEVENAIPPSGTTGQVLAKKSNADYDLEWVDQSGGGGGGGTSNYNELSNKPQIGGVTLSGNKTLHDLGAATEDAVNAKYTKPGTGIPASDLASDVQTAIGNANSAYQKPGSGIPASDLASGVIPDVTGKADKVTGGTENNFAALDANGNLKDSGKKASDFLTSHQDISGKADKVASATNGNFAGLDSNGNLTDSGKKASDFATPSDVNAKYTKPSGGIPASDMASGVQTSLGKADSAYQKPGSGIPASDIASGVIPVLTDLIDDTAGDGDTNKVWSADKSAEEVTSLSSAIAPLEPEASASDVGKYLKAKTVADGKVTEYELDDVAIDPSDVEQAVSDWLTAHPEATTTVQDGSITKAKLASALLSDLSPVLGAVPTHTLTSGKYISNTGAITTSQYYSLTSPIAIEKGDIVVLEGKGYSTSVAMISLTDAEGTSYTPVVLSYDSNVQTFTYVAQADGYYACSFNSYSASYTLIQYAKDSIQGVANRFNPVDDLNVPGFCADAGYNVLTDKANANMSDAGHYIQVDGSYQASGAFKLSASIALPASSTIQFSAKGYSTNVAVLAKVVNGVYTPLIDSTDSNVHTWTYSTLDPINVVISSNKDTQPVYSVYTSRIDSIDKRLNDMENDVFAFTTMGVIGDSLANGASNYSGGTADRPAFAWGNYIARVYGVDVTLFASGGATTRTWLSQSWGAAALASADTKECYIIALGQNDSYSLGDDYLGSASDIHVGSEDQDADTFYGNYGKIIAAIKAKSPRAKIFCLTMGFKNTTQKINYNAAIKAIANLYDNAYAVDLSADPFYTSTLFDSVWYGAHSTPIGYKLIAKNIHDNICEVMRANISDFKDIQWIVENHP